MYQYASSPGINEEALLERANKYDMFKEERTEGGFPRPVGEGVLMWDDVKVHKIMYFNFKNTYLLIIFEK